MAALDNLVVTTALPVIREDLDGSLAALEWIVNGYTLPFACLLLFAAGLGDRFGRRRVFTGGVIVFTLASALAALAGSTGELIAARALQGVGAAVLLPLSLTLITASVPAQRRGTAFGIWGAINGLAVAGGPLVGGAVTEHLSWHWIFWLNVPVGLLLLPLIRLRLPESRGTDTRLDVLGALLASAGLLGVVLGIVRGHEHGWTAASTLGPLGAGVAVLALFVRWERRAPAPLLPLELFRSRTFALINAASLLMFLGMFGSIFLLTQFLQIIQGHGPQSAGLRMLPWTAVPLLIAPLAGVLTDRIGGRPVVTTGLAVMAAGLAWFALVADPEVGYAAQVPAFVLCGLGMAMFFAPAGAMVMGAVPAGRQGVASGVNNSLREVGGALGIALLASVFAARGDYAPPTAFVDGLVPALWLGAAVMAVAALLVFAVPRPGTSSGDGSPSAPVDRADGSAAQEGSAGAAPAVVTPGGSPPAPPVGVEPDGR
ncbi:MFS transporter [Streptomyces sp. ST2-7A]|uniref:MFS transporter n=1 Tax=Streptomyces sp. ST2-7A TaxID=2907214 RepID=UPI001F3AB2C7|nr:MFS transporter [Streptomyces sp. ST2-7A]MCE7078828.1 MFS transporter [Streptomyces sp. ST2-7A]